jgi:hypothetical protein
MLEKVRAVSNPLTIIAIFAGLAEVAGTVALATVNKELQPVFVWFVMGFPVLLVLLFFATWNFNPKVLYAPSDFRNEENFLNTLVGARTVSIGLGEITQQLEDAKDRILRQAVEEITQAGGTERWKLSEILDRHLAHVEGRIKSVQQTADAVAATPSEITMPLSNLQAAMLRFLIESVPQSVPLGEIYRQFARVGLDIVRKALDELVEYGMVVRQRLPGEEYRYQVAPRK